MRRGQERFKPVEGYDVGPHVRYAYADMVARKAGLFPGDRVLDVQTNTGILGVNISRAFTRSRVVCTDALRENLELARENARAEKCAERMDFVLCLPDELPFKDEVFEFSTVGLMLAIEEDPLATLEEMHRTTLYYGKTYAAALDLRRKRGPAPDANLWVFDDKTLAEMREMGYGKIQKVRVAMVPDSAEVWLVMAKRLDPEGEDDDEEEGEEADAGGGADAVAKGGAGRAKTAPDSS